MMHSLLPTGVVRPFGGGVVGVQKLEKSSIYLEGRAGVDITLPRRPLGVRIEGRFQDPQRYGQPQLFLLNVRLRLMLPAP